MKAYSERTKKTMEKWLEYLVNERRLQIFFNFFGLRLGFLFCH